MKRYVRASEGYIQYLLKSVNKWGSEKLNYFDSEKEAMDEFYKRKYSNFEYLTLNVYEVYWSSYDDFIQKTNGQKTHLEWWDARACD